MYVADFETIKNPDGSMRVWLADVCEIGTNKHITFTSFQLFMMWCSDNADCLYFHNLKHDASYMMYWLNDNGYQFVEKNPVAKQYNMLVTDRNIWFMGRIVWDNGKTTEIRDSLKKIPLSAATMAKKYNLPMAKGEIDYTKPRDIYYIPTPEEVEYCRCDTEIVARVLQMHFDRGMTAITMPGDAMDDYRKTVHFEELFVTKFYKTHRKIEQFCRKSYSGGISWVNPAIREQVVTHGLVYDYNSMYPSVMLSYKMPLGMPRRFYGEPNLDLYIAKIDCHIYRKPNAIACIRDPILKTWIEDEFKGELVLTSLDIDNLIDSYYVEKLRFIEGYEWQGERGAFDDYIAKWGEIKRTTTDKAERQIAKLFQNSLYGKFGMNPVRSHKVPDFSTGILKWHTTEPEEGKCVNVAVASFITAAARRELVLGCMNSYGFCYCDTDSLHLASLGGKAAKFNGKIHESDYGAWKCEGRFVRAKYLRQKTYIEEHPNGKLTIAACGCPAESRNYITFDNFHMNASYKGKLRSAMRVGGVELVETRFTIREPLRAF